MSQLLAELKRRNVFRMAGLYLVTAWLLIQIAETLLPIFDTPNWVLKALVLILALGFVPALVFSWVFELTPEGLKLDLGRTQENPVAPVTARRLDRMLLLGMSLIVVLLLGERFWWPVTGPAAVVPASGLVDSELASGNRVDVTTDAGADSTTDTSIAVLPFVNMSADADNEYFADGLTETLLHMLAQVDGLQVTARTSSFAFKGKNIDVREIGRQLGVSRLLEGSVQRAGQRLRITAQLVDARDGNHIWSRNFDRDMSDIFAVQDEISSEVAKTLSNSLMLHALGPQDTVNGSPLTLNGGLPTAASSAIELQGGTRNALAYDLYLRAREAYWKGEEQALAHGIALLREALKLDREFALAWSTLAELIVRHGRVAGIADAALDAEALDAARQAAMLAPAAPGIQAVLGRLTDVLAADPEEARRILQGALAVYPDHPQLLSDLATLEWRAGEVHSALELARRAMLLDPLDLALKADSVHKFVAAGDADAAEKLALSILERNRDYLEGLHALANVYYRTGQLAKAFERYQAILQKTPNDNEVRWRLMSMLLNLGDFESARARLAELVVTDPGMQWGPRYRWEAQICFLEGHPACAASIWEAARPQSDSEADNAARAYATEEALQRQQWPLLQAAALRQAAQADGDGLGPAEAWALAALAALRTEQADEFERCSLQALELLDTLVAQGADNQYIHTLRASAYALRGDGDGAIAALKLAISKGYRNAAQVRHGGFFDLLLDDPALVELLDKLDRGNAEELASIRALLADKS
ncbi:MAG: tetratricopeptide repeat protein [Lysobacterales bacterium]